MKLSVELEKWRIDRPDEWKMDEFVRNAQKLEAERNELAATVEALRKAYKNLSGAIIDMDDCEDESDEIAAASCRVFNVMQDGYADIDKTPQQHLLGVLHERDVLLAQLASFSKHDSPLQHDLVVECERAMKQRDEYLRTKISTAGHGGSHDTCFTAILRNHIKLNEQHLRDVRAEAAEKAIQAVLNLPTFTGKKGDWLIKSIAWDEVLPFAKKYAERVKDGEK